MGIEAGKFFINLGLEGAEKTMSGLSQVNDGFKGLKGFSSEAKLAILAALAGLEQIVSTSAHFGNEITKTTAFLNVNKRELQQWENAAQNAGAAAGDMTSGLQGIQDMMNDIWAGKGPKEFFPNIMSLLSGAGEQFTDAERAGQANYWAQHPLDMLKHLLHASTLPGIDPGRLAYMLQNMNVPMDIFQVNKANQAFSPEKLKIAMDQAVDDKTIARLNKLNFEWERTIRDFEKFMRLVASSDSIFTLVRGLDGIAHGLEAIYNIEAKWGKEEDERAKRTKIDLTKLGIPPFPKLVHDVTHLIPGMSRTGQAKGTHEKHETHNKFTAVFHLAAGTEKEFGKLKHQVHSWFNEVLTKTTASMPPTVTR